MMLLLDKTIAPPTIAIGQAVYFGTAGHGTVIGVRLDPDGTWEYLVRCGTCEDADELFITADRLILLGQTKHLLENRWKIQADPMGNKFSYLIKDKETDLEATSLKLYNTADEACIAALQLIQREFWEYFGLDNPYR